MQPIRNSSPQQDETLFDWDTYGQKLSKFCVASFGLDFGKHVPGWMMYVEREKGLERVVSVAEFLKRTFDKTGSKVSKWGHGHLPSI